MLRLSCRAIDILGRMDDLNCTSPLAKIQIL